MLDDIQYVLLLGFIQRASLLNPVPLLQAAPAARGGRVLRYENRMMTHRRLLSIVCRGSRSQPLLYKIRRVFEYYGQPFIAKILKLFTLQVESLAKCRFRKRGKDFIQIPVHCGYARTGIPGLFYIGSFTSNFGRPAG
jgi:hypothetical protein